MLPAVSRMAWAQAYPTRPITMVVPVPAGGQMDALSRVLAERMRNSLGQPVIIENISGADGSIGSGRVARSRPDGYTIELGNSSTHMLNGALYSLPYDVFKDFAPISPLATNPLGLFARKMMPAKDLNELIAWLKANPNKASVGVAAASHRLNSAFFQKETGTQYTLVPYRGIAPAFQDLVAGQIDLLFGPPDLLPLVRAGNIKAYALTGDARSAHFRRPRSRNGGRLSKSSASRQSEPGSIAAYPVRPLMSGSISSGPGANCEIGAMDQ